MPEDPHSPTYEAQEVEEENLPALLSEPALAEDWTRAAEDVAWQHLQREVPKRDEKGDGP